VNDTLNVLLMSSRAEDVVSFLDHFAARDQLVEWLTQRPRDEPRVRVVDGDASVATVVIPTANSSGLLATRCVTEIFPGVKTILVEGKYGEDGHFNLPHNINVGLSLAAKGPSPWIVIASDDMIRMDGVEVLVSGLNAVDSTKYDTLFTEPDGVYHSMWSKLGPPSLARRLYWSSNRFGRLALAAERKFGVKVMDSFAKGWRALLGGRGYRHLSIASFGIVSRDFVRVSSGRPFNESFIAEAFDVELSLRLTRDPARYSFVRYRIGEDVGATLGMGFRRRLTVVAANALLNHLIESDPSRYFRAGYDYTGLLR